MQPTSVRFPGVGGAGPPQAWAQDGTAAAGALCATCLPLVTVTCGVGEDTLTSRAAQPGPATAQASRSLCWGVQRPADQHPWQGHSEQVPPNSCAVASCPLGALWNSPEAPLQGGQLYSQVDLHQELPAGSLGEI